MNKTQKALVVQHSPHAKDSASVDTLNEHLASGWHVLSMTAMGGAGGDAHDDGPHFASLVLLEQRAEKSVSGFGA